MTTWTDELKELRRLWTEATVELLEAREAEQLAAERGDLALQIGRLSGEGDSMRPQDAKIIEVEKRAAVLRVKEAEARLLDRHEAFFGAWRI